MEKNPVLFLFSWRNITILNFKKGFREFLKYLKPISPQYLAVFRMKSDYL
jgi:hypothetical protein